MDEQNRRMTQLLLSAPLTKEKVQEFQRDAERARKIAESQRTRTKAAWKEVWANKATIQDELHKKCQVVAPKKRKNPSLHTLLGSLSPEWSQLWGDRSALHRKMKTASLKPSSLLQGEADTAVPHKETRKRSLPEEEEEEEEEDDDEQEEDLDDEDADENYEAGEEEEEDSEEEEEGDGEGEGEGEGGAQDDAPPQQKSKMYKRSAYFLVISDSEGEEDENRKEPVMEVLRRSEVIQMREESRKYRVMVGVVTGVEAGARVPQKISKDDTVCHHCDEDFLDNARLKRHLKVLDKERTFKYQCKRCTKKNKFMNKHDYEEHKLWHEAQVEGNAEKSGLQCDHCNRIYRSTRALKKHQLNIASKQREAQGQPRPFQCRFCKAGGKDGKGFHKKDACTEHEKACASNRRRKSRYCKYCGHEFFRLKDLHKHLPKCDRRPL